MKGHVYTDEQIDFLKSNRPSMQSKQLAQAFNAKFKTSITADAIGGSCLRRGFVYRNNCQFEKGFTPWNAGKKGYIGANKTSFKVGTKPPNHRPVGTERIDREGYVYVKVAEGIRQFRPKHHLNWEAVNGKIPKSHALIFIDGDRTNCDIDNLVLVSRGELAILNKHEKFSQQPVEIRRALINLVKLERATK